jgi:hypothetical protein
MKKYNIITLLVLFTGCASNKSHQNDGNQFFDLLHVSDSIAYKSITIEDYKEWENDEC